MKKLFALVFLMSLLLGGVAYAEIGAAAYTGNQNINTLEQQVYIMAYNSSTTAFLGTSHEVVILDGAYTTSGRASNAVGTYFTTTTTVGDTSVLGVTDGPIAVGAVGKVIVRGPAKVELAHTDRIFTSWAAGVTIATSTIAGQAIGPLNLNGPGQVIGTLIAPSSDLSSTRGDGMLAGATPATEESDSTSNVIWWAWIGKE